MFFVQTKNRGHFPFQKDNCPHVICRDRFPNGPFGELTLHLREEKRGQWMSLYMGMLLLGAIFGPTFGGILADTFDMRAPFFAYAIITGLAVIPTLVLPRLTNSGDVASPLEMREIIRDMRNVLTNPSFLLVTFTVFTTFLLRTGVRSTLVPLFAANNLGLDSSAIGLVLTIGAITTAFT